MAFRTVARNEFGDRIVVHLVDETAFRPHVIRDKHLKGTQKEEKFKDPEAARRRYAELSASIDAERRRSSSIVHGQASARSGSSFGKRPEARLELAPSTPRTDHMPYLDVQFRDGAFDIYVVASEYSTRVAEGVQREVLDSARSRIAALQAGGSLERVHFSDAALSIVRGEVRTHIESVMAEMSDAPAVPSFF
jgi:hypothetical protein